MSENKGYIYPEALVDAEWVQDHLTDYCDNDRGGCRYYSV